MMTSTNLFDDPDDFDFHLCDPSQPVTVNQYDDDDDVVEPVTVNQYDDVVVDDQQESVEHNFHDSLDNHCSPNPLNNQQLSSPGNSEEAFISWLKSLQEDSTVGYDLQVSSNPSSPSSNQPPWTVSNHHHMNKSKKRDASQISGIELDDQFNKKSKENSSSETKESPVRSIYDKYYINVMEPGSITINVWWSTQNIKPDRPLGKAKLSFSEKDIKYKANGVLNIQKLKQLMKEMTDEVCPRVKKGEKAYGGHFFLLIGNCFYLLKSKLKDEEKAISQFWFDGSKLFTGEETSNYNNCKNIPEFEFESCSKEELQTRSLCQPLENTIF